MSLFSLIQLISVVMGQNPYLNGTKTVSTETWNRIYILWFLTLWLLGGMNHAPVRHDLTSSLLWLELQNIGLYVWIFQNYTHTHTKPMCSLLWPLFLDTFHLQGSWCCCLMRAASVTCDFQMLGHYERVIWELWKCTENCCANLHQVSSDI